MLIDSGADICIFHADIGRALGIRIQDGESFQLGGVTGSERIGYFHRVTLRLGVASYKAKIGFTDSMRDDAYGMLGQKGFFDRFVVKFDYAERKVIIHRNTWML